ncbi:NitT/TauT family transport system substrate-binding protein [Methylovirgula ligni]|uniref:NitT/TauT family transport system substrate-binding protein n=2 Tax=Methylovirgula ligni TaxID=569860 RepID=A0A3D9YUX5_9HYPH|nr:NitT/TauT family transport system substrate-binding protein [Methylovirgula ligni]
MVDRRSLNWRGLLFVAASIVQLASAPVASAQAPAALTKIRVAETPGLPTAFIKFGIQKGFFKDEGLDAQVMSMPGGAQEVAAALSGDVQFTGGDVVAFTIFRSHHVPVVIVSPGTAGSTDIHDDYAALIVPPNSPVKKPQDLAGKLISTNELNNIGMVLSLAALEKYGVAPSQTHWAEMPLPDVMAALQSGQIAAGYVVEPFLSIAKAAGFHAVLYLAAEYGPHTQIGISLTTESFLASNPKAVAAFQRAHQHTAEYVMAHPDEYRAALVKIAGIKPAIAAKIHLPVYLPEVNRETLTRVGQTMVKLGVLDKAPDTKSFYAPAP